MADVVYGEKAKKLLKSRNMDTNYFSNNIVKTYRPNVDRLDEEFHNARSLAWSLADQISTYTEPSSESSDERPEVQEPEYVRPEVPSSDPEERRKEIEAEMAHLQRQLESLNSTDLLTRDLVDVSKLRESLAKVEADKVRLREELTEARENDPELVCFNFDYIFLEVRSLNAMSQLDVNVPEPFFAKEPSVILKWLESIYSWSTPARDECQMKKRALTGAFTGIPFYSMKYLGLLLLVLVLELFSGLATLGLLLYGARGLSYATFRHPINCPPSYIWANIRESRWWHKEEELSPGHYYHEDKSVVWRFMNPFTVVLVMLIALGLFIESGVVYWFAYGLTCVVSAALASLLLDRLGKAYSNWHKAKYQAGNTVVERRRKREMEAQEEAARKQAELDKIRRDLEPVVCGIAPKITRYEELPQNRRTLTLRYLNLKSKHCKPFVAKE